MAHTEQDLIATNKQLVETIKKLQTQLDRAVADIQEALLTNDVCNFCAYKINCPGDKSCSGYEEGRGVEDEQGKAYDWEWSCLSFDYGTCDKMKGTPCENCDFKNHFMWRGLI